MNKISAGRDDAGARPSNALQFLVTFAAMASAEWRNLVAEVSHAFTRRRSDRTVTEDQRSGGQ